MMTLVLVLARWVHFTALAALFGAALFRFYGPEQGDARISGATIILLRAAAILAAVSGLAWLFGIIANMAGGFSSLDAETLRLFFTATPFGLVSALRLVGLAALLAVTLLPRASRAGRMRSALLLLLAGGLFVSQAWLGHAAEGGSGPYGRAMILAYGLHVLAGAAWVGSLPVLLIELARLQHLGEAEASKQAALILMRFSALAMAAVLIIVLSGLANLGFRVDGSFARLLGTTYGLVLCVKLGLVALMLALAYYNRFIALPQLRTQVATPILSLRLSIVAEGVIGVLVLAAAALLGITPPPA